MHAAVAAAGDGQVCPAVWIVGCALLVEVDAEAGALVEVEHAVLQPVADVEDILVFSESILRIIDIADAGRRIAYGVLILVLLIAYGRSYSLRRGVGRSSA